MYAMKKFIIITMVTLVSLPIFAQDDVYYVPKKDTSVKTAKQTYYSGSNRDIDEYNRRVKYRTNSVEVNDSDIISFDGITGEYPDSLENENKALKKSRSSYSQDYDDDYVYSRELNRWYGLYNPWFYGPGYYSPYSYGYGFYSPYYGSYYGYYDPWYSPYYSGWYGYYDPWYSPYYSGWYGYYNPWYYGNYWGGYDYYRGYSYRDTGGIGAGYSNRGTTSSSSNSNGLITSNRRTGGNVYNDIAKKNQTRSTVVSSGRYTGTRYSDSNTNTGMSRSYTPTYSNPSTNTPSYSGGSRSSGGGSFGGGSSSGGGMSGGGGHGGRR